MLYISSDVAKLVFIVFTSPVGPMGSGHRPMVRRTDRASAHQLPSALAKTKGWVTGTDNNLHGFISIHIDLYGFVYESIWIPVDVY